MRIHMCSLAFLLAVFAAPAHADTIFLRGKEPLKNVKVVSEDMLVVKYTKGKSTRRQEISASEVTGIVYEGEPRQFRRGVEFFGLGDYTNAASMLSQLVAGQATEEQPWLREYAGVYLGRAHLAAARFEEAVASFRGVLSAKPRTRWLRTVTRGLVRSHLGMGQFSEVGTAVASFKSTVSADKLPAIWADEFELLLGDSLIQQGKWEDAATLCRRLALKVQQTDPKADHARTQLFVQAKRLEGEACLSSGDFDKAEAVVSQLKRVGAVGFQCAVAAARNVQAEIYIKKGERLEEAAHQLAQANVENFTAVSELPRTCYLLGLVYQKLSGDFSGAKALARKYFEETVSRFPETPEALLARRELKK